MLLSHQPGMLTSLRRWSARACALCFTVTGALLIGVSVSAQQKPGTLPSPSPQTPIVEALFPPGGQRGSSVTINLRGRELADGIGVWTTFPVQAKVIPDAKEPASRCQLKLAIPKDAPLGVHALRIATSRGVSNLVAFCVDDLPEVLAAGNNRSVGEAQKLPVPCVVSGQVEPEASYYFRLPLQAGQRICLEIVGRRMGSPLDCVLVLQDASGRQVAFSDDAPGLQRDPRLIYTAKESGEYLVQLRDVRYQGGSNFVYRMRVGDFPCATTAFPLVVPRGAETKIAFAGPYLEGVSEIPIRTPPDVTTLAVPVVPHRPSAPPGWPVSVGVSDILEVVEQEPNDTPEKAQRLTIPVGVNARFGRVGDRDHFRIAVKKGQRLVAEARTWEYGSPSSVYLVLRDALGKQQLATSNPMQDPPRIEYTAPADGELVLAAEHLLYAGGPEETYRLVIRPAVPEFRVEALQDRVEIPAGSVGVCFLRILRSGYTGPIRVHVAEPRQIRGEVVLAGEQSAGVLTLSAEATSPMVSSLRLLASAKTETGEITLPVTMNEPLTAAFNNLPYPPAHLLTALTVSIAEPPPFELDVRYATERLPRGQTSLEAVVRLQRQKGFEDEVQVLAVAPPPAPGQPIALAAPVSGKIARGQSELKLALKLPNNLPTGQLPIAIFGQAKHAGRSYRICARGAPPEVVSGK